MHAAKLASLESAIRTVAAAAQRPNKENFSNLRVHDGVEYCLPQEAVVLQADQVRLLLQEQGFSEKFSAKYLTRLLNVQLAEVLKDENYDLRAGLELTLSECSGFSEAVDVYLALEGVRYKLPTPLSLGDITLAHGDEALVTEAKSRLAIVAASSLGTEETKAYAENRVGETLRHELLGHCVVRFAAVAEPERAMERAREEARFVLALLRFVGKFVYPLAEDMRFGLRGERTTVNSYGFVASDQRFHTMPHRNGSLIPFEITHALYDKLTAFGLVDLANRRREGRSAPIDVRVERALNWLSVGLMQEEPATRLVTMMISLEALFSRGPGQSIASAVADSTAFLLGKPGEGRRRIAKDVHDLYRIRSGLAHGGSLSVTSSDLILATYLVLCAIRAVLEKRDSVHTIEDLYAWIDGLKYG